MDVKLDTLTEHSLFRKYHHQNASELSVPDLEQASIREGVRVFHLMDYRDVPVYLMDETTRMASGTFESLVALVAISHATKQGHKKLFFSSGGNLSEAFAMYAQAAGIKTLSFNPEVNIPGMNGNLFGPTTGQMLVGVADAQKNRDVALAFNHKLGNRLGYNPLIPQMDWRQEALRFRGLFLRDMLDNDLKFEAVSQTISAAFGPLAMFEVLPDSADQHLPRFLGVQQEANCYMYQRWKNVQIEFGDSLIVPTLFDHNPDNSFGTFHLLEALLKRTNGDVVTVNQQEFSDQITNEVLERIRARGINHTRDQSDEILARSGLMALAGTLKAIAAGTITKGPVLVCMCDGIRDLSPPAECSKVIESEDDLDELVEQFVDL